MVGIVLTDGISRVVLAPAGPPALGYPTRIEVATGPFSATIEAEALDYKRFLDAPRRLHETLVGEAEMIFDQSYLPDVIDAIQREFLS